MKLKTLLSVLCTVILVAGFILTACEDDSSNFKNNNGLDAKGANVNKNDASENADLARLEFPHVKGGQSIVVTHRTSDMYGINYSLEWDCEKKTQRWSCYQMYSGNSGGYVGRYDTQQYGYPQDPQIPADKRFNFDPYWGTGYDHGHICPSADRQYSVEANTQTFYISNMQPQRNIFNAGVWADMEGQLRNKWNTNKFRKRLYVCKGGTIDNTFQTLGTTSTGLIIPRYFFMAILCEQDDGTYKALGFWIEHKNSDQSRDLRQYVVNIDRLEELTDIDFFCNLPDNIEKQVESTSRTKILEDWNF